MNELGAVILAAGLSSRMGEFKPLLEIGGKTLISHTLDMMKNVGASPIAIVTGFGREMIEECLNDSGVIFVHNERFAATQMLDSLILGLDALSGVCGRILVAPVDVPLVLPETVEALLRLEGAFVRPVYKGMPGHPVVLKKEVIPVIKNYSGEGGLRGAIESAGILIAEMETDDIGVVLDADTKADYKKIVELYSFR